MFGKAGMAGLMKQAQQMQEKMKSMQDEIAQMQVTGESGGGLVKATVNGQHEVLSVSIDPDVMDDKDMLEDLIVAALNHANARVSQVSQEKMAAVTGGLNIPGMKLPF
jgi:DNA-binding YbaB/EbfC family protein